MAEKAKPQYAPIPMRAFRDDRLSERHFRTLGVIAAHDRLNANGTGCWASNKRLAALIGCSYTRLSENVSELGQWGYLQRDPHPLNRKMRVLRVIYTDADRAAMTGESPAGADANYSSPSGETPAHTVRQHSKKTRADQNVTDINIFRESGNTLGETHEIHSPEGGALARASLGKDRHWNSDGLHPGERLRRIRDGIRSDPFNPEVIDIWAAYEWLRGIALDGPEEYGLETGDGLWNWAAQLHSEICDLLEVEC